MRLHRVLAVLFALVLGGACGSDQDPSLDVPPSSAPTSEVGSTTSAATSATFEVELTGEQEAPGPGDEDGTGRALLTLVPERSEVCYEVEVSGIESPTAAHIHRAPAGEPGDVVLDISPPTSGGWKGCAAADSVLVEQLSASPSDFYVNVHTSSFPNGALRGQLS